MTFEAIKSTPITNLDATPVIVGTAGEGAPGALKCASDYVATNTTASQWSTYRLSRFPTNSKVKHVWMFMSGVETATTTGAALYDFNVAFSDSVVDGTPPTNTGAIPSNKFDGTAFTFNATTGYSTAYTNTGTGNKMFGASIAQTSSASQVIELTFKNTFTPTMRDDDLWNQLGFVNAQATAQDPGGFFDIFAVLNTAATTGKAGTIGIEIDYVL